VPHNQVIIFP